MDIRKYQQQSKIVTVKRLSICKCSFPLFGEHVQIGDTYEVDAVIIIDLKMQCGGCKRVFDAPSYIDIHQLDKPNCIPIAAFQDPELV